MKPTQHFSSLIRVDGVRLKGIISPPTETDKVSADYGFVALVVRVRPNSLLRPAEVVEYAGVHYLTLEHYSTEDWRTLRLMQTDGQVSVVDTVDTYEEITDLQITMGSSEPVMVWASKKMIPRERPDYVSRVAEQKFSLIMPTAPSLTSTIDGERVCRVVPVLGAYYVEVR